MELSFTLTIEENMLTVQHGRTTYFWNGFAGFFFVPVGPGRKRERIIKEGTVLYATLRELAGYP
jgi:hypothetical protein